MIKNGFIINPYWELLPDYKICPFSNKDIFINRSLPYSNCIDNYFSARFYAKEYTYTQSGREAIHLALKNYDLQPFDVVTILTSSGNFYISSCVTKEIEIFCKWSRVIEPNTKVLFINHEFGYPFNQLENLKMYNLPIIEDCAHTFFSKDEKNTIGTVGDFTIYSLPKMFPIQTGGLLVSNLECKIPESVLLGAEEKRYIKNTLSHYIMNKDKIIEKRHENYLYLSKEFEALGLLERFKQEDNTIPGVFMFQKGNLKIDLPELKKYFYAHGIQCSVFYGEQSFFIPVHQSLSEYDLTYFIEVMKSFLIKAKL